MYSQNSSKTRRGAVTLNNYGGKLNNYVVGKYDPYNMDVQYELVRIQSNSFNPWYPIREEIPDQQNNIAARNMPPPVLVQQQQQNVPLPIRQQQQQQNVPLPMRQQQQQQNVPLPMRQQQPQYFNLQNSCPSCVSNNKDCDDCNEYGSICFAPACSTMKDCRSYAPREAKRPWCVVTAPII